MPQMSPMLWLNLYIYFFILLLLIICLLYFIKFYKSMILSSILKMKNNFYSFEW